MNRSLSLLSLTLGLLTRLAAAQPTYDLDFQSEVVGSALEVTVRIRTDTGADDLGTSNLVFTYNDQALHFAATPAPGTDYTFLHYTSATDPDYGTATVTRTVLAGPDRLSINIELNNDNAGTVVPASFDDPGGAQQVVRLTFTITDPAQASQLTWEPGNTVAFDGDNQTLWEQGVLENDATVLPVELTAFEALRDGGDVLLSWRTASEANNAGFHVEMQGAGCGRRKGEGTPCLSTAYAPRPTPPWTALAFVQGAGTTTAAQAYAYRLSGLAPGTYRFRLKQVDLDGTFAYSPEVEVTVTLPGAYALSAPYPNPFNPQASFTLSVARSQAVRLELFDVAGRRAAVLHDGVLAAGDAYRFTIEGSGLPSGLYVVRAQGEHFHATRQALLVK